MMAEASTSFLKPVATSANGEADVKRDQLGVASNILEHPPLSHSGSSYDQRQLREDPLTFGGDVQQGWYPRGPTDCTLDSNYDVLPDSGSNQKLGHDVSSHAPSSQCLQLDPLPQLSSPSFQQTFGGATPAETSSASMLPYQPSQILQPRFEGTSSHGALAPGQLLPPAPTSTLPLYYLQDRRASTTGFMQHGSSEDHFRAFSSPSMFSASCNQQPRFEGSGLKHTYLAGGGHSALAPDQPVAAAQTSSRPPYYLQGPHVPTTEFLQHDSWEDYLRPLSSACMFPPTSSVTGLRLAPVRNTENDNVSQNSSNVSGGTIYNAPEVSLWGMDFQKQAHAHSNPYPACAYDKQTQYPSCSYDPVQMQSFPTDFFSSAASGEVRSDGVITTTTTSNNNNDTTAQAPLSPLHQSPSSSTSWLPPRRKRRRPPPVKISPPYKDQLSLLDCLLDKEEKLEGDKLEMGGNKLPPFSEEYVDEYGCLYPGRPNAPTTTSPTFDDGNPSTTDGPRVYLSNYHLWRIFHEHETEMLINRQGRNMYPVLEYHVTGLDKTKQYACLVDMVPVDQEQILEYTKQGKWLPRIRGYKTQQPQPPDQVPSSILLTSLDTTPFAVVNENIVGLFIKDCIFNRVYLHPDSPNTGHHWMKQTIAFNKLKLTNHNDNSISGQVVLKSLHKYQPRFHFLEMKADGFGVERAVVSAIFKETQFVTVTSYHNPDISDLKIQHNPLAKGFLPSQSNIPSFTRPLRPATASLTFSGPPAKIHVLDNRSSPVCHPGLLGQTEGQHLPGDWFSRVHFHADPSQTIPSVQQELPLLPQSDNHGDQHDHHAVAVQQQPYLSQQQPNQEAVEPYSRPQQDQQTPGIRQWSPQDLSSVFQDVWPGSSSVSRMSLGSPASH